MDEPQLHIDITAYDAGLIQNLDSVLTELKKLHNEGNINFFGSDLCEDIFPEDEDNISLFEHIWEILKDSKLVKIEKQGYHIKINQRGLIFDSFRNEKQRQLKSSKLVRSVEKLERIKLKYTVWSIPVMAVLTLVSVIVAIYTGCNDNRIEKRLTTIESNIDSLTSKMANLKFIYENTIPQDSLIKTDTTNALHKKEN
jgi:hypothetical protein